ncbi:MAG: hypothetical protein HKN91_08900 [Acidimicrobiia bacterium]|nr:hypothetical protein [Acidimicrobiia bacterium]
MTLAPRLIAFSLVVGASLWSLAIATRADEPFSTDAAVLVAIGLLAFAVIAAVGLLLPRGRWARNLARALLIGEVLLAAAVPLDGWAIPALVLTGLGVIGIQGKWLDGWLRRLPAADGPGLKAMLYALGALAMVPAVGLAAPGGVEIRQGLLGALGVIIAWGYSKAQLWALWAGRLLLPVVTVVAALASEPLGAVTLVIVGSAMTYLAWTEAARLAISPLMEKLPGPRRMDPKPEAGS